MDRLTKTRELISLALMMASSRGGVALKEIENHFAVSRRTAERMRDAILDLFPAEAIRETTDDHRVKRWALTHGRKNAVAITDLTTFSSYELTALETAAKLLDGQGMGDAGRTLDTVRRKVQAMLTPKRLRQLEPDLEALAEAEGIAMRPGPRQRIESGVMEALRHAILASNKVRLHYRGRGSGLVSRQIVWPYGFLYGNRHYLVAFNENEAVGAVRLFALANIERVLTLTDYFTRDPGFSLQGYTKRSFGVFQEEPFDVAWKFSPAVAEDVKNYVFHPTQVLSEEADGSVVVRFRAGGALEMVWHLFTWGDEVEILAPDHLIALMEEFTGWEDEDE